jgi:hypothetical protein
MNYQEKLTQARERKGWPIYEAAWQVEAASIMTRNNYYDVEQCEGALTENCSLAQLVRVCQLLDIHPRDLFSEEPVAALPIETVVQAIKDHCAQKKITTAEFENAVGWLVESALDHPRNALREWNIDCLKDVCDELGLNWLSVISGL